MSVELSNECVESLSEAHQFNFMRPIEAHNTLTCLHRTPFAPETGIFCWDDIMFYDHLTITSVRTLKYK